MHLKGKGFLISLLSGMTPSKGQFENCFRRVSFAGRILLADPLKDGFQLSSHRPTWLNTKGTRFSRLPVLAAALVDLRALELSVVVKPTTKQRWLCA